jgi:hypothetical protein
VVLALGESNNGRLKTIKSSPVVRQDHTEIYGVSYRFSSPDATQTIWIIHSSFMCQEVFSNKLIICDFICWFSAKQTNSLVVHRSIFSLSEDAFCVSDVKRV